MTCTCTLPQRNGKLSYLIVALAFCRTHYIGYQEEEMKHIRITYCYRRGEDEEYGTTFDMERIGGQGPRAS